MDDIKTLEDRISGLEGIVAKQQCALRMLADVLSGHQAVLEALRAGAAVPQLVVPVPVPMLVN